MKLLRDFLATATLKESTITFLGTAINAVLGAAFYVLAARFLGPEKFGLMSISIIALTLISDIGDLGINTGLVNFVPRYIKTDLTKAKRFLKLALEMKVVIAAVLLVLGFVFSPYVAQIVFAKPELVIPLRISFFGVAAMLLFSFAVSTLQAFQRFWVWSVVQIATNFLRLLLFLGFLYLGIIGLENTLWIYVLMPAFGFLLGLLFIKPGFLKISGEISIAKEFFKYNKWVAVFGALAAVGARLDTFISARLLDARQVGLYSAANELVKIVPMIIAALGTVIAPKMASQGSIEKFVAYFKKTQVMVLGIAILGILAIPVILWLLPLLFGIEYVESGSLFVILLFAMLVFLISVPVHMSIFYYFSKPKIFVWLSFFHLLIALFLGWKLISSYGVRGAAVTVLIGQTFNFVVPSIWVLRQIHFRRLLAANQ